MTRASVMIVSWNGEAYLKDGLDAVLQQMGAEDEIIVVDNASTDGSAALVQKYYPQVRLIVNERNLGYAGGCNVGLRAAQGDFLFLLNQDVVIGAGWLAAMLEALSSPQAGVAGCKLLYPDGLIQHAGGIIRWPRALADHWGYRQSDDGRWDTRREVDYVIGAAWGFRRAVMERIGLLDEGYWPGYYEDADYCFRARQAGWQVVYIPEAVGVHYEATSLKQGSLPYLQAFHRGRLRFVFKWTPAGQWRDTFLPAEAEWLKTCPAVELDPARRAYRATVSALPEWIGDVQACAATADVLEELHKMATEIQEKPQEQIAVSPLPPLAMHRPATAEAQERLAALHLLPEYTFRSRVPLIGPLVAWLRTQWNNVSTRWYVRPVIQQQSEFNGLVVQQLSLLRGQLETLHAHIGARLAEMSGQVNVRLAQIDARLAEVDARLVENDRSEVTTLRNVAELSVQVAQMNRLLVSIEAQLARLEKQEQQRP